MLVVRHINETALEIDEYMAVHAFAHRFATQDHFDYLLRIMNLLLVAGQTDKKRKYALDYAQNNLKPVLTSIKERFYKTKKLGVNGAELKELRAMLEFNKTFWQRQTGELFVFCQDQVTEFYNELEQKRAYA